MNTIIYLGIFESENSGIKNLPNITNISKKDSNLVKTYNKLAWDIAYNNIDSSIYLSKTALLISRKIDDPYSIANSLQTLGKFYYMKNSYDTSLYYYNNAIDIIKNLSDDRQLISVYNDIVLTYNVLCKYDKSIKYGFLALELSNKYNDDADIAYSLKNIGAIYHYMKKYNDAISNYLKSIEIAKKINNVDLLKNNYNSIASVYALKKDFTNAYKYSSKYNTISDSIYTLKSNKQIAEISTNYETQKKENILLKQNTEIRTLELRRSRTVLFIFIIIIIAISILVALMVKSLKNLKKTTKMLVDQNFVITQKSNIITDNLKYAKIIQTSLLPSHNDFKKLFPDSFLLFMPKDIIGGDFIWFKCIKDTNIFALIDCTGHGVSAAFMSVIGNTLLNKIIVEEGNIEPADILYKLDASLKLLLASDTENGFIMDGMDIALCTVKNNTLTFSGSYMPICLVSDENLKVYKGARYLIGGNISWNKCCFINETVRLKKGDYIYMLSDGYYDQFGGQLFRPLRFKNFEKLIISNYHLSMSKQKEFFQKYIIDWIGDYEQIDDITLVGIKF